MIDKIKFQIFWRVREFLERLNILLGKNHILVYTMGKVGSTSIYYALKKTFGAQVVFIHRMNQENLDIYNEPFVKNKIRPHRSALALYVKRKLIDKQKPVSIVSTVREPISRNISCFFQDFKTYNFGKNIKDVSVDEAIENFVSNYPHQLAELWFRKEFTDILGIRLDHVNFDRKEKFVRYEKGNLKLLVFRTDLDNDKKDKYLKLFLGNDTITVGVKNANHQKAYHSFYSEFLEKVKLPKELVDEVYAQDYIRTFFTEEEVEHFRSGWYKN